MNRNRWIKKRVALLLAATLSVGNVIPAGAVAETAQAADEGIRGVYISEEAGTEKEEAGTREGNGTEGEEAGTREGIGAEGEEAGTREGIGAEDVDISRDDTGIEEEALDSLEAETLAEEEETEAEAEGELLEEEPFVEEIVEDEVAGAGEAEADGASEDVIDDEGYVISFDNLDEVKEVPENVINDTAEAIVGADGYTTAKSSKYIPIGHKSSEEYKNYNTTAKQQSIKAGSFRVYNSDKTQYKTRRKYLNETCLAFATVGALEASYNARYDISNAVSENRGLTVSQGALDLSERAMVYFTYFNDNKVTSDPLKTLEKDSNYLYLGSTDISTAKKTTVEQAFALGGSPSYTMETLAMGICPVSENQVPYSTESEPTRNLEAVDGKYKFAAPYALKEGKVIDMAQKELVKSMILKYGCVSTSIYYSSSYLSTVSENGKMYTYYHHPSTAQNHNILIVGWDDDIETSKFVNGTHKSGSEEKGGWLCKNSYGDDTSAAAGGTNAAWGYEYGYFWLSYDSTDKLLASNAVRRGFIFDLERKEENATNRTYQYDGSAFSKEIQAGSSYANVYKVKNPGEGKHEYLRSVMVKLATPGSVYSVELYADPTLPDPTSGKPLLEAPIYGTVDAAGYYDVSLGKGIELTAEKTFAVVVNLYRAKVDDDAPGIYSGVSGKYTMQVATNEALDEKYDAFAKATTIPAMYYCLNSTNTNHSLLFNTNTQQWEDMYKNDDSKNIHGNLRIKLKTVVKSQTEAVSGQDYTVVDHFERKKKDVGTKAQPVIVLDNASEESGTTILYVGQTAIMKIEGESDASWNSKKEKIAVIDPDGKVTAVKKGVTLISGIAGGVEYKHRIMVRNPSLVTSRRKLSVTGSFSLAINGPYQSVNWVSSKPEVASIDENGMVVANGCGSALIRATMGSTNLKCKITVPKVALNRKAMTLAPESPVKTLAFTDKKIDKAKVTYSSDNPSVAEVDASTGDVRAVGNGSAVITATAGNAMATCTVTVMGF